MNNVIRNHISLAASAGAMATITRYTCDPGHIGVDDDRREAGAAQAKRNA